MTNSCESVGTDLGMKQSEVISTKPGAASPKILLTATNRSPGAARLAISLAKAGCQVSAICSTRGDPLLFTQAVRQVFPYRSLHPLEALTAAINSASPDALVPCDDVAVLHLHELYSRAQGEGIAGSKNKALIGRSLGSPESYSIVSSRYDLLKVAREEGILTPDTSPIRKNEDFGAWQKVHPFPWVLKADGTFGGRGVKIAHNLEEAQEAFKEMYRPHHTLRVAKRMIINRDPFWIRPWWKRSRPSIISQAYVTGRPANCAVWCWKGQILAGIAVEVVSSVGTTGPATIVRMVDSPPMMLAAKRIAGRLNLSGFFGLDFMIEDGSGATYLIEMNPRCTPLCHLQLGKGRDMVGALVGQLIGQPVPETSPVTANDLIAFFPQAEDSASELLHSAYLDYPEGESTLIRELLRPWPDRSLLFRLGDAFSRRRREVEKS